MFEAFRHSAERRREKALSEIRIARSTFDEMVKRAEINGSTHDDSVKDIRGRLEVIERKSMQARAEEFDVLVEEAKSLAGLRAYLCPPTEILAEGRLSIDIMEEWGVPVARIVKLRESLDPNLAHSDPMVAHGALRAVYEEFNSWAWYVDDYNDTMLRSTYILLLAIGGFSLLAIFLLHFPGSVVYGLAAAGVVGGCVSVISKLPSFSVSSEFGAYRRNILSRIATGVVASLIGTALLGWGLVPISIQNQTFADVLNGCSAQGNTSCTAAKILILLGVPMLFGFSERALTSLEARIFGDASVRN